MFLSWSDVGLLALAGVLVALFAALAWWAHLRYWDKKLGVLLTYVLEERIVTPDGGAIELRRIPPADNASQELLALPPVLLVHGLGANHRNHDLHPDYSLARYLSAKGRDVWLVTLRSGISRRTRDETRLVRFEAMASYDIPIAARRVLELTMREKLDIVGFSMGGMLLYAAIGGTLPESQLRRAVIIGSPAIVRPPFRLPFPGTLSRFPLALSPHMRLRLLARTGAFASEWLKTPIHHALMNPLNVSPGVARMSLANAIEDVPGPLNYDFALWALSPTGHLTMKGQSVLETLASIQVPALFFAGVSDRLAPPAAVRAAFEVWGAKHPGIEKRFILLGRAYGAHEDYGHGDMAVGTHVREDIFEPLAAFLGEPEPPGQIASDRRAALAPNIVPDVR